NAIDAMSQHGTLTLNSRLMRRDGSDWIAIDISDTGAGIPPEIREKIFEPFFTTKGEGKGTGLGLSLVHEIVRKHGGSIEIKSEISKGTIFTVLIPVQTP
ncbi:MAG: hypothetical protein HY548_07530, partial [Elusimicrobia bacterium]|nr:hypothetical protein [Elusimicrobiota bacterium]